MIKIDRRALLAMAPAAALGCAPPGAAETPSPGALIVDVDRKPDEVIDLWPAGAPGGENVALTERIVARENEFGLPDHAAHEVTRPTLSVFRPAKPDGSAILIIPGGSYAYVVIEKEGFESARWLSRRGVTAFVLRYRLPHHGWAAGPDAPLQDAQRAMRVIRSRAGIDPARVAVMGFSAGGHLAGSLAMRFDAKTYAGADAADEAGAKPDAAALVYPVITLREPHRHEESRTHLIGAGASGALVDKYSVESMTRADAPPVFLMHAADDPSVPVENSLLLFEALKKAGLTPALHIFEKGGHGFGVRGLDGNPARVWPELLMEWGAAHGMFNA